MVPTIEEADKIVSEQFETRVNAPELSDVGEQASIEINRSLAEQAVRDKLTSIRKENATLMPVIGQKLLEKNLIESHSLKTSPLSPKEIKQVNQIIDEIIKKE